MMRDVHRFTNFLFANDVAIGYGLKNVESGHNRSKSMGYYSKAFSLGMIFYSSVLFCCQTDNTAKEQEPQFRDYSHAPKHVREFYELQHKNQTYEFAKIQRQTLTRTLIPLISAGAISADVLLKTLTRLEQEKRVKLMSIWDALMELDKLVDDSDPDFSLPNSYHAFQTAEAIRKDLPNLAQKLGMHPSKLDWFILAGLLHDLGKIDAVLRKVPQWAVVGDTFPLGCQFSDKNIFYDYFKVNPDFNKPEFQSPLGIYGESVGINNLVMSYGHDEYAYRVLYLQGNLPREALSIIRFHSCYPIHQQGAYKELLMRPFDTLRDSTEMAFDDSTQIRWVQEFSRYDLYSKKEEKLSIAELEPFYRALINKYFPPLPEEIERKIAWPILPDIE
jgi:inositol oxygenase